MIASCSEMEFMEFNLVEGRSSLKQVIQKE